jgi:hypothetical protein
MSVGAAGPIQDPMNADKIDLQEQIEWLQESWAESERKREVLRWWQRLGVVALIGGWAMALSVEDDFMTQFFRKDASVCLIVFGIGTLFVNSESPLRRPKLKHEEARKKYEAQLEELQRELDR